ncbi:hypothetical protein [Streptomyces cinereoruber]|uniref:hypothetical protein n=1 Tax=Streptomyces cinereoruber TaxID=67260 RepID=UPI0036553528
MLRVVGLAGMGGGALSVAARADLAAAAFVVARRPTAHAVKTYDLVGDPGTAVDVAECPAVTRRTIGLGEYRARLLANDALLPCRPPVLASIATGVRHGSLSGSGPDLVGLLDRLLTGAPAAAADTAAAMRPDARRRTPADFPGPCTARGNPVQGVALAPDRHGNAQPRRPPAGTRGNPWTGPRQIA